MTRSLRASDRSWRAGHIESRFGAEPGGPPGHTTEIPETDGESMSADTAGPETRGHSDEEPDLKDPEVQRGRGDRRQVAAADRAGPSGPRQDRRGLRHHRRLLHHLRRLRRPDLQPVRGLASRPALASQYVDGLNKGLPKPEMGPPNGPFTWDHPMGVAPRTGEDNLAYWLYGCRVSLLIATTATIFASVVGVDHRPGGRLPRRRGRQGPLLLHRRVPHDPVPARRADAGADHQRPVQPQPPTTGRSRSSR